MKRSKTPKWLILLTIFGGVIIGLFLVGRITGAIRFYHIPTNADKPGLKAGDELFVSNLVSPKRFDYVCYRKTDQFLEEKLTFVHRLCGLPGDTVEIRNGDLYINGQDVDPTLELNLYYRVPANSIDFINENFKFDEGEEPQPLDTSGLFVYMSKEGLKKLKDLHIPYQRHIRSVNDPDQFIQKQFNHSWNPDHFGPIIVPANCFFVVGDNRYRSEDSRYVGYIPKDSVVGVVIRHW